MNIGVVGLGLIGGSLAKCIKKYTPHTVLGMDVDPQVMHQARLRNAVDGILTAEQLALCDMVLVATWPQDAVAFVKQHDFAPGTVVMDVCGVKQAVCQPLWKLAAEKGFLFVGGHPMAGMEYSGFSHASAALFQNASMIVVPPPGLDMDLLVQIKQFWLSLGFDRVVITTPEQHDRVIALTSQLAHVVSSACVKSPTAGSYAGFSAGSFRDMTRVARLNEEMWTELFLANRTPLLQEMDILLEAIQAYREALAAEDGEALRVLLREGRERKEALDREGTEP